MLKIIKMMLPRMDMDLLSKAQMEERHYLELDQLINYQIFRVLNKVHLKRKLKLKLKSMKMRYKKSKKIKITF